MMIPSTIRLVDYTSSILLFESASSGYAVATIGGDLPAISSSYAGYTLQVASSAPYSASWVAIPNVTVTNEVTASIATSSSYAATSSYLNPITNSYVVLSQVSQSLNFVDDDAAAAGGVPLGGLYRNGNFILIRVGGSVPTLFSGTVNIGYGQCQNEYGTFSVNGNGTTFCNSTELYVYSANSASFSAINDVVGVNYGGQGRYISISSPSFTGSLTTACETCS